MVNLGLNPFTFQFKTNYLENLFLYDKVFGFFNVEPQNIKQYTWIISSMGGSIDSDNADLIITDKKKFEDSMVNLKVKIINSSWLYTLQHSGSFIQPNNFLLKYKFQYDKLFLENAFNLYKSHPHWGYKELKNNLIPTHEILIHEDDKRFKNICQYAFNKIHAIIENENNNKPYQLENLDPQKIHDYFQKLDDFDFKMNASSPNEILLKGPWSETETENLIIILKEGYSTKVILNKKGQINWPLVSKYIINRSGKSCKNRYDYLKLKHDPRIDHVFDEVTEEKIRSYQYNDHFYKSLIEEEEEYLFQEIKELLINNQLVTVKLISEMALKLFNSPLNIATKSFVLHKYKQKVNPFDEKGEIDFTKYEDEFNQFLELADTEPQKLIEDYLKDFTASRTWVFNFMLRHNLVFKKAHFFRRGNVDEKHVDNYLNEIAIAIEKYGKENIVNMDETSVKTQNLASKIIALKGKDATAALDKLKSKEATTFLGAICMDPTRRIPLGIVTKGKTKKSERKFGFNSKSPEFIAHTKNGWTNASVIISYLKWLKRKMNTDNFALIFDVYKSHINDKVKKEAAKLGIQLIYVPASGTATYQPLDIKIFGITKNKLTQNEQNHPIEIDQNRHKNITKRMIDSFNGLSNNSIEKAFKIPSLDKLIVESSNSSESSEFKPEEEDSSE